MLGNTLEMVSRLCIAFISIWPNFNKNLNKCIRRLQERNSKTDENCHGYGKEEEDGSHRIGKTKEDQN